MESYQIENLDVYSKEKYRWKEYLESLKEICEKELWRKQVEINGLHEVLGRWINMYMDLQEKVGIPSSEGDIE